MTFDTIKEQYEADVDALPSIHAGGGGGKARNASGLVYENLIKRTVEAMGYEPRKNDYKSTEEVDGVVMNNLQVDWHIYKEGVLRLFVESKCFLDSSMLMRAVIDMIELHNSPDTPDDCEFAIFGGQDACKKESLVYYRAFFKKHTGKELNVFFVNPQMKRSSSRPIFDASFRDLFTLDSKVYNSFVNWISNNI